MAAPQLQRVSVQNTNTFPVLRNQGPIDQPAENRGLEHFCTAFFAQREDKSRAALEGMIL